MNAPVIGGAASEFVQLARAQQSEGQWAGSVLAKLGNADGASIAAKAPLSRSRRERLQSVSFLSFKSAHPRLAR